MITFRHNDVEDLEAVLKRVAAEDRRLRRPLNRRFILVEGIYANTGEVAPLDKIMPLKQVGAAVVGPRAGCGHLHSILWVLVPSYVPNHHPPQTLRRSTSTG